MQKVLVNEAVGMKRLEEELVHEDEAAMRLAGGAAGPGLICTAPNQGRVNLISEYDGLLKIDVARLNELNSLGGIIFSTLHNLRIVKKGRTVGATRSIPLTIEESILRQAEAICTGNYPLITVKAFHPLQVGVITTGSEVYEERIKDGFGAIIQEKVLPFGGSLLRQLIVPDDPEIITSNIHKLVADGAGLVLVTGGMSVDPDDVTPTGITASGAELVFYGMPVLPGSMFMLSYYNDIPVCGIPGCVLFNQTTSLDLLLPFFFAGERLSRYQIVNMGHGGLCENCGVCHFPACAFGKSQ